MTTVTFLLMTFNQERYVREACLGALGQVYDGLKIIISDDCSADDTYAVIKNACSDYSGRHELVIRRNQENLGLIRHVNLLMEMCAPGIVVLAAGDDISRQDRVEKVMEIFGSDRECRLVHSDVDCIDADGAGLGGADIPILNYKNQIEVCRSLTSYIGATGAIDTELYRNFGKLKFNRAYEDLIFASRAAMLSAASIRYIDERLVKYRTSIGISSSQREHESVRRIKFLRHADAVFKQRLEDLKHIPGGEFSSRLEKILLREVKKIKQKKYNSYFKRNRNFLFENLALLSACRLSRAAISNGFLEIKSQIKSFRTRLATPAKPEDP